MNEEQLKQLLQLTPEELSKKLDNEELDLLQYQEVLKARDAATAVEDPLPTTSAAPEPEPVQDNTVAPTGDRFDKFGSDTIGGRSLVTLGQELPPPNDPLYELAMEIEPEKKEDGIITDIGRAIKKGLDYPADKANELFDKYVVEPTEQFPGNNPAAEQFKGAVRFLDENVFRSADEQQEAYLSNPVGSVVAGGAEGIEGGLMIPLTVAGAIANQNTDPWSDPPEMFKGNFAAEASFEVMQILTPTLIGGALVGPTGGALPMAGGVGGLVGESALETATQDSADEVLLSRTIAYQMGKAADALNPGSGEEVVRTLLNGEPGSQVYLTLLGMFQNMGINVSPDAIRYLANKAAVPADEILKAARQSGKPVEEVNAAVNNTKKPEYTPDSEPTTASSASPDTAVPVSQGIPDPWDDAPKSSTAKPQEPPVVAEDAMAAEMNYSQTADAPTTVIKQDGDLISMKSEDLPLGDDAYGRSTRRYFFNIDTWAKSDFAKRGIEKAAEYYRKLEMAAPERLRIAARSAHWYLKNRDLFISGIDGDVTKFDEFLNAFYKDMTRDVELEPGKKINRSKKTTAQKIKDRRMTTKQGTVIAGFIGEELGVRIQKAALVVDNLQNSGMNSDSAMRNFMRLVQLGENFFVPARQAARDASQGLAIRQKSVQQKAFDYLQNFSDNIAGQINKAGKEEKAVLLETMIEKSSLQNLFRKAKAGDETSKQLLDQLVKQLAYSDPTTLLTSLKLASDSISKAQRSMSTKGLKQLFYAMMLTRGTTQAAAFAVTATRMIAEPLIGGLLSGAGDLARGRVAQGTEKALVGIAQFVGGFSNAGAAMSAFRRAFKENTAINSGERFKIGTDPYTLQLQSDKAQMTYKARLLEIAKNEEGPMAVYSAWSQFQLQRFAFNPFLNYGPRLLQAQDEGFKVMRAAQVAQGDAMIKALSEGSLANLGKYSDESFKDVFQDGVDNGVIRRDTDLGIFALDSARRMTFQRSLPDIQDANFADKIFIALENASETSAIFKYFNPFVRMGWDVTAQTFDTMPGVNMVYSRHFGQKAKKIINEGRNGVGGAKPTAVQKARMMELESGYAAANLAAAGAVWFAWQGLMNGSQGDNNQPADSFIIPLGNGNNMAIDFSRYEPYATWMRIIADGVNQFRQGAISRGEYEKGMQGVLGSMAQSTLDKNIFAGVVDMTEIFNYQNWSGGSLHTIMSSMVGFSPAIVRAMGQAWEPYGKVTYARNEFWGNTGSALNRRIFGGTGLPSKINPFFGVPESKVAVGYGADINMARMGMILQEFLPFKVQNVTNSNNVIYNFFDRIGFEWNHDKHMHQVEGAQLSKDQQRQLGLDMYKVAELDKKMAAWIKSDGERLYRAYQKALRKEQTLPGLPGNADAASNSNAYVLLNRMRREVRGIIDAAKVQAMREGALSRDKTLILQLEQNEQIRNKRISAGPGAEQWKGLYATLPQMAAQPNLPNDIQTILDIA